jgi:uroporphyrinogen III methyltransferase/synthase
MGVKNLPRITQRLIEHGKPEDTPIALVQWGTTPKQVTVTGTLGTIAQRAAEAGIAAPAIIVIGGVVHLRKTMKWFEDRPLLGKTVIVTRAREQASEMVDILSDLGASCLEYPTISVQEPDDWAPLDRAMEHLSEYDWLVFTSVNGVTFFFERLFHRGKDVRALGDIRTASVGPATRERLETFGIKSDIVPKSYRAESVVEAFGHEDIEGKKILLPRAAEARPILPVELTRMGGVVDEVAAYRTTALTDGRDQLLNHLESQSADLITFTSSSTAKNFKALLPSDRFRDLIQGLTVASIGPITSDTAKSLGFPVHIEPEAFTIPDLCKAIVAYYRSG